MVNELPQIPFLAYYFFVYPIQSDFVSVLVLYYICVIIQLEILF